MVTQAARFERVQCPQCKSTYKVEHDSVEAFLATLPDACETCHPKVVRENVGPSEQVTSDKTVQQHEARIASLEATVTNLRQDVLSLIAVIEQGTRKPRADDPPVRDVAATQ